MYQVFIFSNFSGGWASKSNLSKVEAFVAVEMNPSPLFAEESVKENLSYRSIVAWRGGKLQLSDKSLVKRFWHGTVGQDSAHSYNKKGLEAQLAEKINLLEARDKLISCLTEKVRCMACFKVPISAPLYSCPEGHIICSSCYKGSTSTCPSRPCYEEVGRHISLIGLTLIEKIKHSCPYPKCPERLDLANIAEHKKVCSFRPVACPATHCKTEVSYEKLLDHLMNNFRDEFGKK